MQQTKRKFEKQQMNSEKVNAFIIKRFEITPLIIRLSNKLMMKLADRHFLNESVSKNKH